MRMTNRLGLIVLCMCMSLWTIGCGTVVPSGVTVMVVKPSGETDIYTKGVYRKYPREKVYFIDGTLKTYQHQMFILCKDGLNMDVAIKLTAAFDVNPKTTEFIRTKISPVTVDRGDVTGLEISFGEFFKTTLQGKLSSIARSIIAPYNTDAIQDNRVQIEADVRNAFIKALTGDPNDSTDNGLGYPVLVSDLVMTNINPPEEILLQKKKIKAAEMKQAENAATAIANLEKAKQDATLAAEKGKALLVEAQADAAANDVRAQSLTPEILAMKQLETLVKLAEGDNNMVVVIPYEAIGSGIDQKMVTNSFINDLGKEMKLARGGSSSQSKE